MKKLFVASLAMFTFAAFAATDSKVKTDAKVAVPAASAASASAKPASTPVKKDKKVSGGVGSEGTGSLRQKGGSGTRSV